MTDKFTEHFTLKYISLHLVYLWTQHSLVSFKVQGEKHLLLCRKSLRWLIFQIKEVVLALKGKEGENVQHLLLYACIVSWKENGERMCCPFLSAGSVSSSGTGACGDGIVSQGVHKLCWGHQAGCSLECVSRGSGVQRCCRTPTWIGLTVWMCVVESPPLAAHTWGRKAHPLLRRCCVLPREEHKHVHSTDIVQGFSAGRMKLPE